MAVKNIQLEIGTVYKKSSSGNYYFRYQVNGQCKAVSLKTKIQKEAVAKANEMIPILKASTTEIISAHVKYAKGLASKQKTLRICDAWDIYSKHPERATPATVSEQNAYKSTFQEFQIFLKDDSTSIHDITPEIADKYAQYLRGEDIAVDTHNRKIRRLCKIFNVLKEYRDGENPFIAKSLRRKERGEQGNIVLTVTIYTNFFIYSLFFLFRQKYTYINCSKICPHFRLFDFRNAIFPIKFA